MEAQKNPTDAGLMTAYQKRITAIMEKLADKMGTDVNALEVRELVGEYDFVAKQLYQMEDVTALMLELAQGYKSFELNETEFLKSFLWRKAVLPLPQRVHDRITMIPL